MSPGPLFDPQGIEADYWRFGDALVAAGFERGDVVLVAASYHFTPLGFIFDAAARALGCRVVPSGVGNTELQVAAAAALHATAYCGTPSFLKMILDKAQELGTPLALRRAFVAGEMLPESLRSAIQAHGVSVQQGYGTADLGCLGYECTALTGFHVAESAVVEIVDPATSQCVPVGQVGEVVATVNCPTYPLIRFGTGDLSALDDAPCRCGRGSPRLLGIIGRVGEAVKVRGMFVHPRQLSEVLARFPEVQRHYGVVDRANDRDTLLVQLQLHDGAEAPLPRIAESLRDVLHVRPDLELVGRGTITDEQTGKLVDRRIWT
jgi:phenylacetate-CoA ligase